MSRNGSGTYSLPVNSWNPAANGVPATAADWQALINDVASAITQSVSRDGQTTLTGNLPMGSNKLTGLASGTAAGDSLRWEQLFSQGQPQDLASAATTDIGAQLTTVLNITGTTTITSFGTNYNGPRFVRFAGALTLTHGAALVLPGAANITTAAGDAAIVVPLGTPASGWRVVAYQRGASLPVSGSDLQSQTYTAFTTAGTAPAFTLTPSPAIAAYAANQRFRVAFNAGGTTGSNTLNVSGLGAKNLKQYDATGAKVAGVVTASQLADVEYDGTDFVILDPLPSPGSTTQKGVVQLAIGAEAQALSDALKAITPATLAAALQGANQSLGANGYQKLPGGLILQWGSQANAGLGSGTITLPIAFPTVFTSIAATVTTGSAGHTVKANSTSLSQFTWSVLNLTGASTGAFTWIAIGY